MDPINRNIVNDRNQDRQDFNIDPFDRIDKYDLEPKVFGLSSKKIGVNELCPCGSKKKFKKCCMNKDSSDGYYTKKCRYCNCTIRSFDHFDYLNHVENDRSELNRTINEIINKKETEQRDEWAKSDKPIRSVKDLEFKFEVTQEVKEEVKRRVHLLNDLEKYLKEQRKLYPLPEI